MREKQKKEKKCCNIRNNDPFGIFHNSIGDMSFSKRLKYVDVKIIFCLIFLLLSSFVFSQTWTVVNIGV